MPDAKEPKVGGLVKEKGQDFSEEVVPTLRFEEDESLPVKKRREKQGADQVHGVGGSPGHRRTRARWSWMEPRARGMLPDEVRE